MVWFYPECAQQKAISKSTVKTVIALAKKKQSYTVKVKVSCYVDVKQYHLASFSTCNSTLNISLYLLINQNEGFI